MKHDWRRVKTLWNISLQHKVTSSNVQPTLRFTSLWNNCRHFCLINDWKLFLITFCYCVIDQLINCLFFINNITINYFRKYLQILKFKTEDIYGEFIQQLQQLWSDISHVMHLFDKRSRSVNSVKQLLRAF